jgi:MoxR-like ATPase
MNKPMIEMHAPKPPASDLHAARDVLGRLKGRLIHAVRGRDDVVDLLLVALMADGHVLLEDFPGSGKTTLAKALGESITPLEGEQKLASFRRVQFTPDLLPSDITGVSIFTPETGRFHFQPGPLFAYVLLADEINRTSPKVQAAMLESMAEKQVTVDNVTHPLDDLFFVIATQNPRDLAGTFPLPVAQLDRFLFKIVMAHIDRESELDVLKSYRDRRSEPSQGKVSRNEVLGARYAIDSQIHLAPEVRTCLVDIATSLRSSPKVAQGVSTRSLVLAMPALQAAALMNGRDHVIGEDVEWLAPHIFRHRIELAPGVDDATAVIKECARQPLEQLARGTLRR